MVKDHFQLWNTCKPINLFIEDLSSDAIEIGLKEDAIETMIRSKLEAALLYDKESPVFLAVSVSVVRQAFHIGIHLNKTVLDSVSNLSFPSSTWTIGSTGTHGGNESYIMSNISQGIDTFLDEYFRVNASTYK